MSACRNAIFSLGLAFVMVLTGCSVPAQMEWSPDGAAAAYRVKDQAYLVDTTGKVVAKLGDSAGGFAWTKDSKTLYYATASDDVPPGLSPVERAWMAQLPQAPAATQPGKGTVELFARQDGKTASLARFLSGPVFYMTLSPDQQWLAMICDAHDAFSVYAYSLTQKKLYLLSDFTGFGLCFTGPHRLAYVQPDRAADKLDGLTGKIVEVDLVTGTPALERKPLVAVIPSFTAFIQPLGENLLITTVPQNFPGKPTDKDDPMICKLFLWTRATGGINVVADDVGPLFAISPDGERILVEKISPATDTMPAKHALLLIRANGSDGVELRDLSAHNEFAMWPAWHGNDEITFSSAEEPKPVEAGRKKYLIYDIVLYKISDKGELQQIKVLSDGWDSAMKPFYDVTPYSPSTAPATKP